MRAWQRTLWKELGPSSWWVWLFFLCCLLGLRMATERREALYLDLAAKRAHALTEIAAASKRQDELQLQLQSESDPAWIEISLMRWLGLAPEGSTKVYFQ